MNDLVSIIMPVYNGERYISFAIDSVINQTYSVWELIIIDDCSKDSTLFILEKYLHDKRIRLIKLEKNIGPALARNFGIDIANGKYIAFLDADDEWAPKKLEKQVEYIKKNNLIFTCSSYYVINDSNKIIKTRKVPVSITYNMMLKTNYVGNLTGIIDIEKAGKIYFKNIKHEDYLFWLTLFKNFKRTKALIEPLAFYRKHRGAISSNKFKTLIWQYKIYRYNLKLNLFLSMYYLFFYIINGLRKNI